MTPAERREEPGDLLSKERGMNQEACHFNGGWFTNLRLTTMSKVH
ncbi:hypothetical protein [Methanosarcina horonobensis]|nr:hypothetical protein [Methanosarcina horonobensis]